MESYFSSLECQQLDIQLPIMILCLVLMTEAVNKWVKMMRIVDLCEDPRLVSLPSEILPISALNYKEMMNLLDWETPKNIFFSVSTTYVSTSTFLIIPHSWRKGSEMYLEVYQTWIFLFFSVTCIKTIIIV